jgi:fused signal recognition particle receptor
MVAGVNGTGKTTTIGKLAWHLQRELGKTVVLARPTPSAPPRSEQLTEWAQRAGCEIVTGPEGSDPGLRRLRGGQARAASAAPTS